MSSNKKKNIIIGIMLTLIVIMAVAYAAFATSLNINGTGNINSTWDIRFTSIDEISKSSGVIVNSTPTANGTTATFDVELTSPGDEIKYKITVANQGTLNAIVENITASKTENGAIVFEVTGIGEGDTLDKQTTKDITLTIKFDENVTQMPSEAEKENTLTITMTFVQNLGQNIPNKDIEIEGPITRVINSLISENETATYYDGTLLKGNIENNYVWYSGFLWRIMGKDNSGNIKLIMEEAVTTISYHDTSANFNGSNIQDWLNNYFFHKLKNNNIIVDGTWCNDITPAGNGAKTTCTNKRTNKMFLISLDEYNLAGGKNSYIVNKQLFWTLTTSSSSIKPWTITPNGTVNTTADMTNPNGTRPVIKITSNTIITSGDGTLDDAYIIGEVKPENMTGQISNLVTPGEYVSLEGKTYRVVDRQSDGVKLILDGYYEEVTGTAYKMNYGSNNIFTLSSGIGQKLNTDVSTWLGISDNPNVITTEWNQGVEISHGANTINYLASSGNTVTAKVGLIKTGEVLSNQSQTITTRQNYWTLTPYIDDKVWCVSTGGSSFGEVAVSQSAFRPVIKVKLSTNITSGNGTYTNPYQI